MEYDTTHLESIATAVVDAAFHLHRSLGPGLLESVYESVLARMLEERGYRVERQKVVSFEYCGMRFEDGFRADLVVEGTIVVELKSVERLAPVHVKQRLTYLRLLDLRVGFLINFNTATFKEGIQRVVNQHREATPSRLRVKPALPLPCDPA
jgi:iron complex transport system substrate-binding protein